MKSTWHSSTMPGIKEVIIKWAIYQQQNLWPISRWRFSANGGFFPAKKLMKVILKTNQIRKEKCVIFLILELYMIIFKKWDQCTSQEKLEAEQKKNHDIFPERYSCFYFLKERNVNSNINIKAEIQSNEKYLLPKTTKYQRLKSELFFFLYHAFT